MSSTLCDVQPPKKRPKLSDQTEMAMDTIQGYNNDLHTSELQPSIEESFTPKYKTMADLGFNGYKPLFSRQHLANKEMSRIRISLTTEEKDTFDEIKKAITNRDIFRNPVTVRCAGGWVRDKLLNCESDDVDLAVDTMTGEEFGDSLQKYFQEVKHRELKLGKIQENPDKSKHLATVTFKIGNIEFDVANLRTETYATDSRVPIMEFGTAKQDAFRRDLTINALFYNINSGEIEDFTNRGVQHLIDGVVQTPLDAMITYSDDPLRVLRNIRHGVTKLGFTLHDDIIQAAQSPKIHQMLQFKVSRERFSIELEKMLKGHNVWIAMGCIVKFGLAPILFEMPTNKSEIVEVPKTFRKETAFEEGERLTQTVTELILNDRGNQNRENEAKEEKKDDNGYNLSSRLGANSKEGKEIQKRLLFAAFTYPFHGIKCFKAKKNLSLVAYFVLHSIPGLGKKLADAANAYHEGVQLFVELLLALKNEENVSIHVTSLKIGKFLKVCKEDWVYVMYLVKAVCIVYHPEIEMKNIDEMQSFMATQSNLVGCWNWKPLINGTELLEKYKEHGLGRDPRIGQLLGFIEDERLSKPSIKMKELEPKILEWIQNHPAPKHNAKRGKKKKSSKKRKMSKNDSTLDID